MRALRLCTQFTCFTGAKVQILTLKRNEGLRRYAGAAAATLYAVYLLYWYKSTNTDTLKRNEGLRRYAGAATLAYADVC
jgi:hypothetical protein